jgi:hydrogenase maturation protease
MKKIIGCGNLLLKDEGIGVHLIEYLKSEPLPSGVELIDGATGGFDLMPHILGAEKVVIVDAIRAEGKPGDIYKFTPDDFSTDSFPKTSLHDITLKDIFQVMQKMGPLPPITIFGVQPKVMEWGMELSEEIEELLPKLSKLVIEEIRKD